MIPPRLGEPKKPAKNWRQFPRAVGTACKDGGKSSGFRQPVCPFFETKRRRISVSQRKSANSVKIACGNGGSWALLLHILKARKLPIAK
jgi:hypothetical protein